LVYSLPALRVKTTERVRVIDLVLLQHFELIMASAHDNLSQFQLYADLEEHLLICCRSECGYALSVARSQVTSHLRDKHNVLADLRTGLTPLLKHEYPDFFRNPADVALRDDGALIYAKLHLYDGFACRKYRYRTINYSELSRHISKEHLNGLRASRSRQTTAVGANRRNMQAIVAQTFQRR